MRPLLALDIPFGVNFERTLRRCVEEGQPFCVLDPRLSPRRRLEELDWLGVCAVLTTNGSEVRPQGRYVDDEIGLVMLTSGSSGAPKAAELTWSALEASAQMTQERLRTDGPAVWYPCLPPHHIGGLAVVLRAVLADASLLWGESDAVATAPLRGATHVAVVRTQLVRYDLAGFQRILLGGAKPPGTVPDNVITTWGMTETGSGVVYDGVALDGVEVVSIEGELCVRSPTLFRSYRDRERPRVTGPDGRDTWFPTGDGGDVVDGVVRVRGRLGFVINSGGEKIWPEDVEALIATVTGVRDVAVTGVADQQWGERVVALVVTDGSSPTDAIGEIVKERIGPWARPKEVRYVAAIPRTSNGKVRRGDLNHLH